MKQDNKVSVGFVVYNGENYVEDGLKCLIEQDYENLEINICDNGSTDRTPDIYKSFVERDSRIRVFRSQENIGPSRNFEKAFHISNAPYFMWASCDDRRHPTFIRRCVEALDNDPQVALAYPFTRFINNQGEGNLICKDPFDLTQESSIERYKNIIGRLGYCNSVYGIYRSSMLVNTTLFTKQSYAGDVHLILQLLFLGKIYQVPEILYYRNMHKLLNQSGKPEEKQQNLLERKQGYEKIAYPPGYGISMPYFEHIWRFFEIIQYASVPCSEKPELIQITRNFANSDSIVAMVSQEIDRAIQCILQNRFYEEWNPRRVQLALTSEWQSQLRPLYMSRFLQMLEKVLMVYPNYPGVHAARAICLSYLGRFEEAKCAAECEIRKHPEFTAAGEILQKINSAINS